MRQYSWPDETTGSYSFTNKVPTDMISLINMRISVYGNYLTVVLHLHWVWYHCYHMIQSVLTKATFRLVLLVCPTYHALRILIVIIICILPSFYCLLICHLLFFQVISHIGLHSHHYWSCLKGISEVNQDT